MLTPPKSPCEKLTSDLLYFNRQDLRTLPLIERNDSPESFFATLFDYGIVAGIVVKVSPVYRSPITFGGPLPAAPAIHTGP